MEEKMMKNKNEILNALPGKNCGMCGVKTCEELAKIACEKPEEIKKCIMCGDSEMNEINKANNSSFANIGTPDLSWKDNLGREFDFVLDKFEGETGPRETIILFNPANVEKLKLKKGDIIYGRPAWISCGCPVTHVGQIVEDPDYFNGTVTWCIVGPLVARQKGINIGYYNTTAYEGIVKQTRVELKIGMRYYFQPRYCMLQWRHCGLLNQIAKNKEGLHVRIEGSWIG
jgi:uncharacterized Fe-S cluster-containing protein